MCLIPIDHCVISDRPASAYLETFISNRWHAVRNDLNVSTSQIFATIIKVPPSQPSGPSEVSYNELTCTDEDVSKITRLISVMGENGKVVLLFKYQKELRQIGREIEHVHPLKFISVIMSNPYLKSCLRKVHSDYFKWSNFMDGLGNGLSSQHQQGKVSIYLNDFAQAIGVSPDVLKNYIHKQDWENMLIFLMNN